MVTIGLCRVETVHPAADSVTRRHLYTSPEHTSIVGQEMLLWRVTRADRRSEMIIAMDLPFILMWPEDDVNEGPAPASLHLPSRSAETRYELVVTVHGPAGVKPYSFPVPITRYDTLSTFQMYNVQKYRENVTDKQAVLGVKLSRWAFGPGDKIDIEVRLLPNQHWLHKARGLKLQKLTVSIDEVLRYARGEKPKTTSIFKVPHPYGVRVPPEGYLTSFVIDFPTRDQTDSDGVLPVMKPGFPMHALTGFTTESEHYSVRYYLNVKAHLSAAKSITVTHEIVKCPFNRTDSQQLMALADELGRQGLPKRTLQMPRVVRPTDPQAYRALGYQRIGGYNKLLIE
ncbi:hypothetical protein KEM55_005829 [Ascosphaera atra]|nr:hypothetical protein KEM55_005829 [Ascosphaera atra]